MVKTRPGCRLAITLCLLNDHMKTLKRLSSKPSSTSKILTSIILAILGAWHYLLIIWFTVFPPLLRIPYERIAAQMVFVFAVAGIIFTLWKKDIWWLLSTFFSLLLWLYPTIYLWIVDVDVPSMLN